MAIAVGIDIGGTFTDVIALDLDTGDVRAAKSLTSYGDETRALLEGLQEVGVPFGEIDRLVHGTTIGTNAILERRGARTALLVTQGFRDLLVIGRTRRMAPNTLFDLTFQRPEPLIPRALRFDVEERVCASGETVRPLDRDMLATVLDDLQRQNVESVAVCYLHAYAAPGHELETRAAIREKLPGIPVSLSHEVVPEYREFERLSTTVLNAYIAPALEDYLARLESVLRGEGIRGALFIMASSGGVLSLDRARLFPVTTVLSGPAGGVVAAVQSAAAASARDLITCDMGGTSTDVSMIRDLTPTVKKDGVIAGMPIKSTQIDISTVGAGGGSIAWVSEEGQLHVGPRSAGSRPGPICYGLGGTEPTITDANLVLGRLTLGRKLGGRIEPSTEQVVPVLDALARRIGVESRERMADGIIRIAVAKMVASIREISVARGHDPRRCALVAFGGAGPMHATQVAEALAIPRVIVPPHAGNLSALGLVSADLRIDLSETVLLPNEAASMGSAEGAFARLEETGRDRFVAEGFARDGIIVERVAEMRYVGQAHELTIPVAGKPDPAGLADAFNASYERAYGHCNRDEAIEIVNLRLAAIVPVQRPRLQAQGGDAGGGADERDAWFRDGFRPTQIFERYRLPIGVWTEGPAIVEEAGATTVVFPDWHMRRDEHDNLNLERSG
ncbi:MAG: hydantoinase/oxoprolinase family protein [Rhodospirillaceae bacterium]|nr:hydantoinase/oxoprolinase family protein [Rhodospirillaceae bacterium]MYK15878.1 hydantoinase/oxoprolinase family protein [Rhodospirillaceae bacterium]